MFGPYEGRLRNDMDQRWESRDGDYAWDVAMGFMDARDTSFANWMRCVDYR